MSHGEFGALVDSDTPFTSAERIRDLQDRFALMRECVATGKAHLFNLNRMDGDDLAYEAVGMFAQLLRLGGVSNAMEGMLTRYLAANEKAFAVFVTGAMRAGYGVKTLNEITAHFIEHLKETDCVAFLGVAKPSNRPTEDARKFRMVEAFVLALDTGMGEDEAKTAAYVAHGGTWDVEKDRTTARERNGRMSTVFDVRMIEEVNPLLREAKVLLPARSARHGKKSSAART